MNSRTAPEDTPTRTAVAEAGLGAELRESLLLLGISVAVTAAVTVGAHAALMLLG